jgi:hypothetical protein
MTFYDKNRWYTTRYTIGTPSVHHRPLAQGTPPPLRE